MKIKTYYSFTDPIILKFQRDNLKFHECILKDIIFQKSQKTDKRNNYQKKSKTDKKNIIRKVKDLNQIVIKHK